MNYSNKKEDYIVDIETGEVIYLSYNNKNILYAYNLLSYDPERRFSFFKHTKKTQILKILKYENIKVT